MQNAYTAVIQHRDDWWIGWSDEIPGVNCREPTREDLLECLRETLREAPAMNREQAPGDARPDDAEQRIAV